MENTHTLVENKMGTVPINKLLIKMAAPMMLSMLMQAFYNIVDSIFVSRVCEDALTAVSMAFPVQTLLIALATGTGVGMNAMLSKALGEKDYKTSNRAAMNGLFLAFISFLIFLLVGILASKLFFMSQTDDPIIIGYGVDYLSVICIFSFGAYTSISFERLLQSTGKTTLSMIAQLSGAITNIILDPIMIFGLLGFPRLEVLGAAIATIIGQCVSGIMAITLNHKYNKEITLSFKTFRPHMPTIKRILHVGIPSILMQAVGSIMYYAMNLILMGFVSTASAVFGAYFKLQSLMFMPIFGLNNGMIPIIAYNYGAEKRNRIIKTIKLSVVYASAIMLIGFAVFQIFPSYLLLLFDASPNMLDIGIPTLKTASISYIFAGFCIVCGAVFQALGNGIYSLIVSCMRQLCVLLPCAYILSRAFGLNALWWAFPIAEIMSVTVTVIFMRRIYKNIISRIPESPSLESHIIESRPSGSK